jgi:MFS family permease
MSTPEGQPQPARGALASLALCMLLPSLATSIANVALPTLGESLGASFQQLQWVVLAYLLATTSVVVGAGRLADQFGRWRLLLGGVAVFTAASLLCGLAGGLGMLVAARVAQGVGAAVMMALPLAMVGELVPRQQAGRAMGLLGTTSAIGTALGPSLGGALTAAFGWHAIFIAQVPLGLLALLMLRRWLPADRRPGPSPRAAFDLQGMLLLAFSTACYALALTHRHNVASGLLLVAAALGGWLFFLVQARTPAPLVPWADLQAPGLARSLALNALASMVVMATLVLGPFHLARGLGLATALVGLVMSTGPAVAALAGVPAGRWVDRFGAARAAWSGLAGMALGSLGLALLPPSLGIAGYAAPLAGLTAGYALFQAANNSAALAAAPAGGRGVVAGLLTLSRNLGLVSGAALMGALFAHAAGDPGTASLPAVAAGMRVAFGTAAALLMLALVLARSGRTTLARAAQ